MRTRVAVLGTGLIGGSIGLGLRARRPGVEVVGYDKDPQAAAAARERGALSEVAASAQEAAARADLVVLAMPVDQIPDACVALEGSVRPDAAITDVGSAKMEVVERGVRSFAERFVGGHPMAGSERHGIEAAAAGLFEDAWWILTPTRDTSSDAYARVTALVSDLGAQPVAVDPRVHDALVARLSHLPQLAASALVEVAASAGDREALLGVAGAGFRDVTRIAASSPDLWVGIIRANRSAVLEALAGMGGRLEEIAALIRADRWEELSRFLTRARSARLELFAGPVFGGEPVTLSLVIPNRPGVLAQVTTAAGELGVNIEDFGLVSSTEGGEGRLELVVAGAEPAERLASALARLGYHVVKVGAEGTRDK